MGIYHLLSSTEWKTREQLMRESGMSDRKIRDEINKLRKNPNTVVVSSSHGKGYKIPSSVEEIDMCLYESKSRVKDELEKQRVLERARVNFARQERTGQLEFGF